MTILLLLAGIRILNKFLIPCVVRQRKCQWCHHNKEEGCYECINLLRKIFLIKNPPKVAPCISGKLKKINVATINLPFYANINLVLRSIYRHRHDNRDIFLFKVYFTGKACSKHLVLTLSIVLVFLIRWHWYILQQWLISYEV